jgi:serine protease AprX
VFLILAAFYSAGAADNVANDYQKIDPALVEIMNQGTDGAIPVIVMLKSGGLADDVIEDIMPEDLTVRYKYRLIPALALDVSAKAIKEIAEDDQVSEVYFDGETKVSAPEENSTGDASELLGNDYISHARLIKADRLWEKGIDGRNVTVAVIDSGIDKNHPDLVGRVVAEKNFLSDEITADDLLGHGTMVAGIIAGSGAASNGKYKGIAPGADLINVKVIDSQGDGKVSDIIAGIEWAVYSGADVLSLSLGGINLGETNPPITMAADNAAKAGAVVCVAAGNRNSSEASGQIAASGRSASSGQASSGLDAESGEASDASVRVSQKSDDNNVMLLVVPIVLALPPGLIDSPGDGVNVITVGAADSNGRMASFSGSGPTRDDRIKPDVVAPGVDIISTVPSGLKRPVYVDDYYARESGTSLSTPVAAGLAALLLQADKNLTPAGVKAAMSRGADKLVSSQGEIYEEYYQGAGMIDALRSYEILENGSVLCGAMPDAWMAGRWAYLPSGKGVYVGLDTGADRPQKKLYAMAPGDDDWNLRFVFFSDRDLKGVKTVVDGDVADWVGIQDLPANIQANDQIVFSASISVPDDAEPGPYSGKIEISDEDEGLLLDIPVSVTVALPFEFYLGQGNKSGNLSGNGWDYYYLDMTQGTAEFQVSIDWQKDANLDLFLLSPTSEYYEGEADDGTANLAEAGDLSDPINASKTNNSSNVKDAGNVSNIDNSLKEENVKKDNHLLKARAIQDPPSGRWIVAVHSENASGEVEYNLSAERFMLETDPMRWNLESATVGSSAKTQIALRNFGRSLDNLSYLGVIENSTVKSIEGDVLYKEVWEYPVNATASTKKLSASLSSYDTTNTSELMLVFENPDGEPYDALLDTGDLGPLEISRPQRGTWKVKVYGYEVPDEGQSFRILLKQYAENPWSWVKTQGPRSLMSNETGVLSANLTLPSHITQARQDGYIKISSDGQSFEIPVSVTVAGTRLEGLTSESVTDADSDGLFETLSLGFGINISSDITATEDLMLKGTLSDCNGSRISSLDRSFSINKSGSVFVNVSGTDIWRQGRCGPMRIENLILYGQDGTYIDRYEKEIAIDRSPKDFQPPAALLAGEYVNLTTPDAIAIGVNVTVIKPGRYELQGTIVNDYNEELDGVRLQSDLAAGNTTMVLQFDPSLFMRIGEVSRVHLVDLALLLDGEVLEELDYAWATEPLDPQAFTAVKKSRGTYTGTAAVKLGGAGGVKIDNGTMIIS